MKPITIVGGGLAGLTLGIALRQRDVPVTIWEAGSYPRNKVCGEFISGQGQGTLVRLGLQEKLLQAGARWAKDAAFYADGIKPMQHPLPQPALCISRYILDQLLATELRKLGGELLEKSRWSGDFSSEGVVRASGHRVQAEVEGWRWFGLKVYAHGAKLEADLELHIVENGYVGLCRIDDKVNACGLFRSREAVPQLRHHWQEHLIGKPGSALHRRLGGARLEQDSFRAVAGLSLEPQRAVDDQSCALGDALTMIPPVTGNGMSIALESAEIASGPLVQYSRGEQGWDEARRAIANGCDQRFARRLKMAGRLQRVLFQPAEQRLLLGVARTFQPAWRFLFAQTR